MKLLGYKDLKEKGLRYSRMHLGRLVKAKQFPQPIRLSPNRIAWVEEEIDNWLRGRMKAR